MLLNACLKKNSTLEHRSDDGAMLQAASRVIRDPLVTTSASMVCKKAASSVPVARLGCIILHRPCHTRASSAASVEPLGPNSMPRFPALSMPGVLRLSDYVRAAWPPTSHQKRKLCLLTLGAFHTSSVACSPANISAACVTSSEHANVGADRHG